MRDQGLDPHELRDDSLFVERERLGDYRADDPDPIPLLFQTGYLTIRGYDDLTSEYQLAMPNTEMERGLFKSLLAAWAPAATFRGTDAYTLRRLVESGDTDGMHEIRSSTLLTPQTTC